MDGLPIIAVLMGLVLGFGLALAAYYAFRGSPPAAGVPEALQMIIKQGEKTMATVDDILAAVAELPTINDSLDALFLKLQELIAQGRTDPAKLDQALELVTSQKERTKASIVANTPAGP